ncbi:MAG: hypothetical protein DRO39_05045 [Thermoprotei archaeon]|nr:MAG: hypothetical protein DRO39_05045 [Thermoprotei archaeon]
MRGYTSVENAFIDITLDCNASCPFCYLRNHAKRVTMRKGDLDIIFEALENLGVVNVTILGGEPFILPEDYLYFLLFEAIPSYRFKTVNVETNGSRLHMVSEKILTAFDNIYVSVDYYDEKHEKVRGISLFDHLWDVMDRYGNISLTSVYLGHNLPDIMNLSIECINRNREHTIKLVKGMPYEKALTPNNVLALYNFVVMVNELYNAKVSIIDDPAFIVYLSRIYGGSMRSYNPRCQGGIKTISVRVDGTISLCVYKPEWKLKHHETGEVISLLNPSFNVLDVMLALSVVRHRPKGRCATCRWARELGCTGCQISPNEYCPMYEPAAKKEKKETGMAESSATVAST